jgi:ribosomal protein S18 acetylase RimI-like enzyme
MEDYWRGVQMVPERHLVLARLDKVVSGSCQIVRPPRNNEAQRFTCQLTTFFVAPWARGHGLAQMIVAEAEALAKSKGFTMINLDVRSTQVRAIQSFEARGFKRYATNDFYARVDNQYVQGFYYHKELK